MDEILDIVNEMDQVIGTCPRSMIYGKGLINFRVINGFLKNSLGQIWIPRRTSHKKLFPNHLDFSIGGHVKSGETYEAAFVRELAEELNMRAHEHVFREIGYFNANSIIDIFIKAFNSQHKSRLRSW